MLDFLGLLELLAGFHGFHGFSPYFGLPAVRGPLPIGQIRGQMSGKTRPESFPLKCVDWDGGIP